MHDVILFPVFRNELVPKFLIKQNYKLIIFIKLFKCFEVRDKSNQTIKIMKEFWLELLHLNPFIEQAKTGGGAGLVSDQWVTIVVGALALLGNILCLCCFLLTWCLFH